MAQFVRDTKAGQVIAAWIVTDGRGRLMGKVQAHYGESRVLVNAWDLTPDGLEGMQRGSAGGYGYDKLTAALSGLRVAGHVLSDHCEVSLKPPKGAPGFALDHKPRKGFTLANRATWIRDNAESPWLALDMTQARVSRFMGAPAHHTDDLDESERGALDQLRAAKARGDIFEGYTSCHKAAGLDYLKAHGLRVHQAI